MVRKKSQSTQPQRPLELLVPKEEAESKLRERMNKGQEIKAIQISSRQDLENAKKQYYKWNDFNDMLLKQLFSSDELSEEYSWIGGIISKVEIPLREEISEFHEDIEEKIHRLDSIIERIEIIPLSKSIQHQGWRESSNVVKEEPYIFLCHANEDKNSVRDLQSQLSDQGYTTWLDERNLLPGQDWDTEIKKAIKKAEVVLILLSNRSQNKRGYVQKEIKLALDVLQEVPDDQIFLIPAMIEECDIPVRLKSRQAVKLYGEDGFDLLVQALDTKFLRE